MRSRYAGWISDGSNGAGAGEIKEWLGIARLEQPGRLNVASVLPRPHPPPRQRAWCRSAGLTDYRLYSVTALTSEGVTGRSGDGSSAR